MSFKNLLKKITLIAGSAVLLVTAGGAVSANATSLNNPFYVGGGGGADYERVSNNKIHDFALKGLSNNGKFVQYYLKGDPQSGGAAINSPFAKQLLAYSHAKSGNVTTKNANSEATKSNTNASQASNANNYQASNTNNGKLVQTGENNGAEYAAVAGVILSVSAMTFAGYNLRKNN